MGGIVDAVFGGGDVNIQAPAVQGASPEELALQQEMLDLMKQQMELTPYQEKMQGYSETIAQAMVEQIPQLQQLSEYEMELFERQLAELDSPQAQLRRQVETSQLEWQLARIEEAKSLGEITGDLSDQEMQALDTMASNAVTNLTEGVNRELEDVMGKTISSLVDRGVLQSTVGAAEMADVQKRALELISTGTAGIESQKMANIIQLGEAQKTRQLQMQSMVQQGVITRAQMDQSLAGGLMQYAGGQQQFAQQFAQSADQFTSGLSQQWDISRTQAGLQAWGQMAGMRGAEADRALSAAIASSQATASTTASAWGALGTAAGMAGAAAISSKRYKKNIKRLGCKFEEIEIVSFEYNDELNMPGTHIGVIAEEVAKIRPDAVVFDSEGKPDKVNYTQLFQGVQNA